MNRTLKSSAGAFDVLTMSKLQNTDLDTLTTAGIYWIAASAGCTNLPETCSLGSLTVLPVTAGIYAQIFIGVTCMYMRIYKNSAYEGWQKIQMTAVS